MKKLPPWLTFGFLQVIALAAGIGSLYVALPLAFFVSWPVTLLAGVILLVKGVRHNRNEGLKDTGYVLRVVGVFLLAFVVWAIFLLITANIDSPISDGLGWELASVPALAVFSVGSLAHLGLSVFGLRAPPLDRVRRILASDSKARVGLRASSDGIAEAEHALGLRLPRSFVEFLTSWGEIEIGATRILGCGPSHLVPSSAGFVEETLRGRSERGLLQHLVLCASYPNDMHVCLDTFGMRGDEGPVVLWSGSTRTVAGTLAPTFGEFLRSQLETQAQV